MIASQKYFTVANLPSNLRHIFRQGDKVKVKGELCSPIFSIHSDAVYRIVPGMLMPQTKEWEKGYEHAQNEVEAKGIASGDVLEDMLDELRENDAAYSPDFMEGFRYYFKEHPDMKPYNYSAKMRFSKVFGVIPPAGSPPPKKFTKQAVISSLPKLARGQHAVPPESNQWFYHNFGEPEAKWHDQTALRKNGYETISYGSTFHHPFEMLGLGPNEDLNIDFPKRECPTTDPSYHPDKMVQAAKEKLQIAMKHLEEFKKLVVEAEKLPTPTKVEIMADEWDDFREWYKLFVNATEGAFGEESDDEDEDEGEDEDDDEDEFDDEEEEAYKSAMQLIENLNTDMKKLNKVLNRPKFNKTYAERISAKWNKFTEAFGDRERSIDDWIQRRHGVR